MAELQYILNCITHQHPEIDRLSKPRLIKILYLADWRSAIVRGEQITPLQWFLGSCGLYCDQDFEMPSKKYFLFSRDVLSLTGQQKKILNHVIENTWEA